MSRANAGTLAVLVVMTMLAMACRRTVAAAGCHASTVAGTVTRTHSMATRAAKADVVVEPSAAHGSTVVLLHGLGDSGQGWREPAEMLARQFPSTRWVLPNAPDMPVTLNGGAVMPSWYDLTGLDERDNEHCEGIEESRARIAALVAAEQQQTPVVVLGGFSQGGALAMYTALLRGGGGGGGDGGAAAPLAGLFALSSYLPRPSHVAAAAAAAAVERPPMLFCHGTDDPMVHVRNARASVERLRQLGVDVDCREYPGLQHHLGNDEFRDWAAWLRAVLPPPATGV